MCGVIGFCGDNTLPNRRLLRRVFAESTYRGLHSLGVAWQEDGRVEDQVTTDGSLPDLARAGRTLKLIGHTRYCTSDPVWPLPIVREGTAVVLNGVISQEPPSEWPRTPMGAYVTGNDAEIALCHYLTGVPGRHGGSFAVGVLQPDGGPVLYRNGSRPLWVIVWDTYTLVVSTVDIARRAGVPLENAFRLPPGCLLDLSTLRYAGTFEDPTPDIQPETPTMMAPCTLP